MVITRESGQEAVVNAYLHWHFLLVEYCTGFGKGKAALEAVMKRITALDGYSEGIIVVSTEGARDYTWPREIQKWAPDLYSHSKVKIVCYNSLHLHAGKTYDWVIVDECQYLTPHNALFFEKSTVRSIILMTGTLPEDTEKIKIIKKLSNRRKLTITLDQAIRDAVLNDYIITVWNIQLSASEWNSYLHLCKKVDEAIKTGNNYLIRARLGDRMQFIYTLESKYQASCYVRDRIAAAGRRAVIFCGNKAVAYRLCPHRLYTGTGTKDYDDFNSGKISMLSSIKMIQDSANIYRLESALMNQVNSKSLNFMQKLGRLMRLEAHEVAKVHIICAVQTYDANWVRKALREVDPNKITYMNLDRKEFTHYI